MSVYSRISLIDLSPFHIGRGTDNYDTSSCEISSDMLVSALASMRAENGKTGDLSKFIDSFILSSAFPFYGKHYFLPRIPGKINVTIKGSDESTYRKLLKNIKYIEDKLWMELMTSKESIDIDKGQLKGDYLLASTIPDFKEPIKHVVMQRVKVPQDNSKESEPFYFEWNFVRSDSGLYCLLKCDDDTKPEILSLFEQLGVSGIGSDKNIGGGHFKISSDSYEIPDMESTNAKVLLSTYIPSQDELNNLNLSSSKYELILRGGYMAGSECEEFRHLHRKSVYMFNTGSKFKTSADIKGIVVDLAPDWNDPRMHPVYRSGKAFTVNINI